MLLLRGESNANTHGREHGRRHVCRSGFPFALAGLAAVAALGGFGGAAGQGGGHARQLLCGNCGSAAEIVSEMVFPTFSCAALMKQIIVLNAEL